MLSLSLSKLRLFLGVSALAATPLVVAQTGGPEGDGNLAQPRTEEVPVARFEDRAGEYLEEMRSALAKGVEISRIARADLDALRLHCANEKVSIMQGVLRNSEDSKVSLKEALSTRATERARYEFNKIRTSRNKMSALLSATKKCVGAEATYTGGSALVVDSPELSESYYEKVDDPFYTTPDTQVDTLGDQLGTTIGDQSILDERPPVVSIFQG
jgi:hypothetical protein